METEGNEEKIKRVRRGDERADRVNQIPREGGREETERVRE